MPVDHMDTVLGGADISGDASPVQARPPAQRMADMQRQVDHRPKPQAAGARHLPGEDAPGKPSSPPADEAQQPAPAPPARPRPSVVQAHKLSDEPPHNPLVPVDWKKRAAEDPWATSQHSSQVAAVLSALGSFGRTYVTGQEQNLQQASQAIDYTQNVWSAFADSHSLSQSVKNIWDSNTAQGKVAIWVLEGLIGASPPAELVKSIDKQFLGADERQATADVAGGGLPMTAQPLNLVPGGTAAQLTAWVAPNVIQALGSNDPNVRANALTWAAITGTLLSAGHMSALRPLLSDALGKWPELEKVLDGIVERRKAAQTAIQDPQVDHLAQAIQRPAFPGSVSKAAPAATGERLLREHVDPVTHEIYQTDESKARLKDALKHFGASDRPELERMILENRLGPEHADDLTKSWGDLGYRYDLNIVTRPDSVPIDPMPHLKSAPPDVRAKGVRAMTRVNAYIDQLYRGHLVNDADPLKSLWRSLNGLSRGTDAIDREGVSAMLDLAGHIDGELLTKAIEGDKAVFDQLPAEGKAYVSAWALLRNEERLARQRAGVPFAVGDHLWRVMKRPRNPFKGGGTGGAIVSQAEHHRTLKPVLEETPEGDVQVHLTQAHETVASSNAAQGRKRSAALSQLTDWTRPLTGQWANDPEAKAIREQAVKDVPGATQRAKDYSSAIYRDFETNAHLVLARGGFGRQIKAIHAAQAVDALTSIKLRVPNPDAPGSSLVVNAAYRTGEDPIRDQLMRSAGYTDALGSNFRGVLVHPELAQLLDRSTAHAAHVANRPAALKAALKAETAALRLIMYNPMVHGWNVAARFLTFAGMHAVTDPAGLVTHLFGGGKDWPAMDREATNAGVLSHGKYAMFLPDVYRVAGDALGEHDLFELPLDYEQSSHSPQLANLAGLGRPRMNVYQQAQNLLWTTNDRFAKAAYHIEKHSALASGMTEAQATRYGMLRANSWAGYVAPEDTNPAWHDAGRLLAFAPAWWRTWAEIFAPHYKNSGVALDRATALHMVKQEVALIAAFFGLQYVSGNVGNLMLSGHSQDRNQPQNRHKWEVTNPGLIRALQAVSYPGAAKIDPATGQGTNGEVLAMENPLGRAQRDLEMAAGLDSGHPDYQPSDTGDGLSQFLVNRMSPILGAAGALANVDLYQTVKDRQLRGLVAGEQPLSVSPESALAGLFFMTPGGSNVVRQSQSNQAKPADLTLPGGAKVPAGVAKVAAALPSSGQQLLWQAMTGTNSPYTTVERTRGQTFSDDEYLKFQSIKSTYEQQMTALDAEAAGGSLTPGQWLAGYRRVHGTYADQASGFFVNAPEYAHGPLALTASWENTYRLATQTDGSVDPAALAHEQAKWKAGHSPAEFLAVQAQLAKSDRRFPMQGLYHKTLDAYGKWQESWAASRGLDVNQIRAESREYGALYGDRVASARYLSQHRDLQAYEIAKRRQFETSPAGLMWGLFYDSTTVANYMRARHLSATQVEAEVQAQP